MKPSIIASLLGVGLVSSVAFWSATPRAMAQADRPPAVPAPGPAAVVVAPAGAIPPGVVPALGAPATSPAVPGAVPGGPPPGEASAEDLQLSFQGANVDMVVQWLAKVTGKTVVKHPRVQCQVTVVGSKKMTTREAINVVYRALSLEGFTAVETSNSILLVPEGQDVKMSPEVIDAAQTVIPEGRQKLIKIFALTNLTAVEMKEKIRGGISDKGTIDVVDRSNQLMVTDLTDNLRLVAELIKALDVPAAGDASVQFYSLKYSDAEEIGNLMNLVLNAQPGSPSSSSGGRSSSRPGMPMMDGMPPGMPSPGPAPSGGGASAGSGSPLQIRIWPDKVSNRLIVAAPKARFQEVEKLLATLDTEKPRDVTIRVLPLKNVSAEDLVREIAPMYQKSGGGKTGKEGVEITANSRSNSLIIFSSESNYNEILKLVAKLDTDEAQEKVMETFPLKNADAEDTAKQLQDIYKDDSNSRYPYYYFSSSMGNSKDNKKVKVVADRRRNAVIVQAPPAAMENLGKLIATLDEPSSDNALAPKIYKLKYVNAMDLEDVLNELFLKKPQQRNYYYFDFYDGYNSDDSSSNSRDSKGGKLYGKVRITSEPYSNSLIISANSAESLKAVEDVVKELDAPSEAGESTFRVGLKFAKARDVASSLNILFAKAGSPPLRANAQNQQPNQQNPQNQQNQPSQNGFSLEQEAKEDGYFPWLGGQQENTRGADGRTTARPVSDLVGKVRVVPDKRINSLLISCNMHFLPQVMKLITDLDAAPAQVLIEAKIIEVASDFRDKLGVRWSPDGAKTFDASDLDGSMAIKGGATYNKVFTGSTLADALKTGVLSSSVNLDVLIQFMRKTTDSRVLAEPQISIADNELGKLFVGSQVPFISGSLNTDVGGRNDTFQYKDVGIILEVTPRINDAQEVALRIRAESSSIRSGETLFGGAILDTRNFRTDVMVKSGETVVLGGIIQREESNTLRKTPGLGSVPGLGWAFKKKDKTTREVELMVFLRPWVSRGPEDTKKILDDINRKAPLINQTQEADAEQKAKAAQEAEKRRKR